jgi:hypothetical protein
MPDLLTEEAVEYLRRHAPVGCRDWSTVRLLLDRGVPAFFSGCLTTTFGNLGRSAGTGGDSALPTALVEVTSSVEGEAREITQVDSDVLLRGFGENLEVALRLMDSYRESYRRVITSRLHCYLPTRAMGVDAEFFPPDPGDIRFDGLIGLDDEEFFRMSEGIGEKIAAVLGWILESAPPEVVYARWAEFCEPDVAAARLRTAA